MRIVPVGGLSSPSRAPRRFALAASLRFPSSAPRHFASWRNSRFAERGLDPRNGPRRSYLLAIPRAARDAGDGPLYAKRGGSVWESNPSTASAETGQNDSKSGRSQDVNAKRSTEAAFWQMFERDRPRILGALLDAVSGAMARRIAVKLPIKPRMADFAVWTTAAEPALGWESGTFVRTYLGSQRNAHELSLEGSPFVPALYVLVDGKAWEGTASELLVDLDLTAEEHAKRQRAWPSSPQALSNALRRIAPSLRSAGFSVDFGRTPGTNSRRLITLRKAMPLIDAIDAGGAPATTGDACDDPPRLFSESGVAP